MADYNPYYYSNELWQAERQARHQLNERYAHPLDDSFLKALRRFKANQKLREAISREIELQYGQYIQSGLLVTAEGMPRVHRILVHCATSLIIPIPYTIIGKGMQSSLDAYTLGTDEYAYLILAPRITVGLSESELTFVIGHEAGHIALEHVLYHTMVEMNFQLPDLLIQSLRGLSAGLIFGGSAFDTGSRAFLAGWQRSSEISADRAGLLCCRDLRAAERVLVMSAVGATDISPQDIDLYLEALSSGEKTSLSERMFSRHPEIHKRVLALRVFANSLDYYQLLGLPMPIHPLYDRFQLIKKINEIIGI